MRDFSDDLGALRQRLNEAQTYLKIDAARVRVGELEVEISKPDLWDDQERAKAVNAEYAALRDDLETFDGLSRRLEDAEVLHELAREEGDESQEAEIVASIRDLAAALDQLELRSLFTGEHDERDAVCTISAKDGGTDAQDFAEMLLRMYSRWAERRGFELEIDEVSEGQEAGILSANFVLHGRYAYGLMQAERGVHRLVRISPFDANARRQTSFVAVNAVPALDDVAEVEIDEKDLRIDVYRSSGAGGQHVNVTDSAVRITHLPTGIVTSCQNERSQHQNKAKALANLAAILAEKAREDRAAELEAISGPKAHIGWGSQIRSYVMQPYQLVKDLRSGYEVGNVNGVLDGDLDDLMEAYLRWKRAASTE
jgi:peptide chain release factor 2